MIYVVVISLVLIIILPKHHFNASHFFILEKVALARSKSSLSRARLLINLLGSLSSRASIDKRSIPELPRYKNYTSFIYQVLDYSRTMGGPIRELIKEIQSGVVMNYRFDIQIKKIRDTSKLQMFLTALIIWSFAFFTHQTLNSELSNSLIMTFILLQGFGLIFEHILISRLEVKLLAPYEKAIFSLLNFKLMSSAGLSLNETLRESQIQESLRELPSKSKHFEQSFHSTINNWKNYGGSLLSEIEILSSEFHFALGEQLDTFKKSCSAIQFLIMVLFYFPCFFLLIASLMQHFSNTL